VCSNCAAQANIPKTQEKLFLGDAFLQGICGARKPPETYLKRLLISSLQVRVLAAHFY
jgi:hypothetical protein